jgi:hypothetical protein
MPKRRYYSHFCFLSFAAQVGLAKIALALLLLMTFFKNQKRSPCRAQLAVAEVIEAARYKRLRFAATSYKPGLLGGY